MAAAEPFSDGITELLDDEDCQGTPTATASATKPAASATAPATAAPAATATPTATAPVATPTASPTHHGRSKPTASATATRGRDVRRHGAAASTFRLRRRVAPAAANPLLNLTNPDPFAGGTLVVAHVLAADQPREAGRVDEGSR